MKQLSDITPLILTYNEKANIERTLQSLLWARDIVILDSGSTDGTVALARTFPSVRIHTRPFDSHASQWSHGVRETGIASRYILALDADMATPPALVDELADFERRSFAGGLVPVRWCYEGVPLRGSLCPPQLRLFDPRALRVSQPGHTQVFEVDGEVHHFRHGLNHDDRKPIERWLASQLSYSKLEAERLARGDSLRLRDRLRRRGLMPAVAAILAFLRAGGPLGGRGALRYAWERSTYETILAIRMLSRSFGSIEARSLSIATEVPRRNRTE